MRSTDYAAPFISQRSAVIGAFDPPLFRRVVVTSAVRFCTVFLLLCFVDRGNPNFDNFNSAIPVDVIRVKSNVDSFLAPTCVPVRVFINKFNLVP